MSHRATDIQVIINTCNRLTVGPVLPSYGLILYSPKMTNDFPNFIKITSVKECYKQKKPFSFEKEKLLSLFKLTVYGMLNFEIRSSSRSSVFVTITFSN